MKNISIAGFGFLCLLLSSNFSFAQYDKNQKPKPTKEEKTDSSTPSATTTDVKDDTNEPEPKGFSVKKLVYGGGIGLSFGNNTYIQCAPRIGYRFTKKFNAGISSNYIYQRSIVTDEYTQLTSVYKGNILGLGAFANHYIWNNIFASAEFEENKIWYKVAAPNNNYSQVTPWYPSMLLGGGIRQSLGGHLGINMQILYDVLQVNPLYQRMPIIRGGIFFGM